MPIDNITFKSADFFGLNGTIPSELSALDSIEHISVIRSYNLFGTLPSEFMGLRNLEFFQLHVRCNNDTVFSYSDYSFTSHLSRRTIGDGCDRVYTKFMGQYAKIKSFGYAIRVAVKLANGCSGHVAHKIRFSLQHFMLVNLRAPYLQESCNPVPWNK